MAAPKGNQFAKGNRGGGRLTVYKIEFINIAKKMCALGATDADIADAFKVSIRTIDAWKHAHKDFAAVLKVGKAEADDRVERSLYQRALGYSHDSVKIMVVDKAIEQVPFREHFPPDTTAAIFWLKNRRPEQWREKAEIMHTGKLTLEALVAASMPLPANANAEPEMIDVTPNAGESVEEKS